MENCQLNDLKLPKNKTKQKRIGKEKEKNRPTLYIILTIKLMNSPIIENRKLF